MHDIFLLTCVRDVILKLILFSVVCLNRVQNLIRIVTQGENHNLTTGFRKMHMTVIIPQCFKDSIESGMLSCAETSLFHSISTRLHVCKD